MKERDMLYFFDADICLDLIDTTRTTSGATRTWYEAHKSDTSLEFYFSGDFITDFYRFLTQEKKMDNAQAIRTIDQFASEVKPFYIDHDDYHYAKLSFKEKKFDNFEKLIIIHSAIRCGCSHFMTNHESVLALKKFALMKIETPVKD